MRTTILILVIFNALFLNKAISSSVEDVYNEKHQKIYGQLMTMRYNELMTDGLLKLAMEFQMKADIKKDTADLSRIRENINKLENEAIDLKLDTAKFYKGNVPKTLAKKIQDRENKYKNFMENEYVQLLDEKRVSEILCKRQC
ncbi:MAG: hypothetical protein GXY42_01695 [Desulfovibrionales bacterium]|nr:hypothetical protein [Desulfovibrionales bacterium]